MKFYHTLLSLILMFLYLLFAGCKDKKAIAVYLVSKPVPDAVSPSQASMQSKAMPQVPLAPTGGTQPQDSPLLPSLDLRGTPPTQWEAQPLAAMRQASYLVKGNQGTSADISLVTLTGVAGGVLDNINRWLSQLGRPAITAAQLKDYIEPTPSPLGAISVVDLKGLPERADAKKDGRIIAGIVGGDNGTYFFKMRGNAELVESQKGAFLSWIGTVQLPVSLPGTLPEPSGPVMPPVAPSAEQSKPQIVWTLPANWKPTAPSPMRYASFIVTGKNGESGDVSVSSFAGDAGGDLANVNRWRSQIGLESLNNEELKSLIVPLSSKDAELLSVDMNGPKKRVLAGWTQVDRKSWFFKLSGPASLLESEKASFRAFLQSVKFHP